jgi:hypothetical protein
MAMPIIGGAALGQAHVEIILVVRVMQHVVEVQIVDPGDRDDVAGARRRTSLDCLPWSRYR